MTRSVLRAVAVVAVSLSPVLSVGAPARAHGGGGRIEVVSTESVGDLAVSYRVRLVYANDGHVATGSTVTATPIDVSGRRFTPVLLSPAGTAGEYEAVVHFDTPGMWTVRVTAADPPATLDIPQEAPAAAGAGEAPSRAAATPASGDPKDEVGTPITGSPQRRPTAVPPERAADAGGTVRDAGEEPAADSGSGALWAGAVTVLAAAALAVAVATIVVRRRTPHAAEENAGGKP
jgi:hypothetical protein